MARVVASAASGELRDSHYVRNPVTGEYERATLVEKSSVHLDLQSENFGTTWTASGTPTRSAAAHTASGVTLDLIGDDAAGAIEYYVQTVGFTGNGSKAVSVFVKKGTSQAAAGSEIVLTDTTAVANRLDAVLLFDGSGIPGLTMATGSYLGYEALVDGVYRLYFKTTTVTAANTNTIDIRPARTLGEQGNIYAGGFQLENSEYPTSYVKTTTLAVTRNADTLYAPYTAQPQELTLYVKGVERGSALDTSINAGLVAIGGSANASLLVYGNGSGMYTATHRTGSDVSSTAAATPAWGDLVELRIVLAQTGTVTIAQSLNGGAEVVAATSSTNALATAWLAQRIYIGERNGTPGAFAFLSVKLAHGTKTLAEMRALHDMATSVLVLNAGDADAIFLPIQSAQEQEPTDIGDLTRAFDGSLRISTRDQKRVWNVTSAIIDAADRDAVNTLIADNAVFPVSGILMGNETINASVKSTGASMISGSSFWVLNLRVTEV